MRSVLRGILLAGVLLLLLSALVVSTETPDSMPTRILPAPRHCCFTPPRQENTVPCLRISQRITNPDSVLPPSRYSAETQRPLVVCDANGRPIIGGQYEENVYTLYIREKAAG